MIVTYATNGPRSIFLPSGGGKPGQISLGGKDVLTAKSFAIPLFSFSAIDRPWDAEAIDAFAEAHRPECFLEGHFHLAAFGESGEDSIRFCDVVDVQQQRETLRLLIGLWRIGAGQFLIVIQFGAGPKDFFSPLRRRLLRQRRISVSEHHVDFAGEAFLVEPSASSH